MESFGVFVVTSGTSEVSFDASAFSSDSDSSDGSVASDTTIFSFFRNATFSSSV
jgi:hypothetical protein